MNKRKEMEGGTSQVWRLPLFSHIVRSQHFYVAVLPSKFWVLRRKNDVWYKYTWTEPISHCYVTVVLFKGEERARI